MKKRYTEITLHRGFLIVEHLQEEADEVFTPISDSSFGCVVKDVSHVAISPEAHAALAALPKGSSSLGELDLFQCDDGTHALGTMGGFKALFHLDDVETSRQFDVPPLETFQPMENTPPDEAVAFINEALGEEEAEPTRH